MKEYVIPEGKSSEPNHQFSNANCFSDGKSRWATKNHSYFPLYWLFNRDALNSLYTLTNQGFLIAQVNIPD